ncbi:MAG TPA: hypothetical protein VED87_09435, partial [Methylocystis sp.]|nr:hypothetical protein [Methylocystis sp.]
GLGTEGPGETSLADVLSLKSSVLTKMAKIGSSCGGESRDDAHLGDGASCGDRGAAEAGQVVAIGAGDALDQAEPAHASDLPGERSRPQAGDKGSQVCSAQSADVELRTLQGAEQCLLASLEEVQPFDQAIFVAAILGSSRERARTPALWSSRADRCSKHRRQQPSRMSRRSIRLIDRLLEGRQFAAAGAVAMFHPAVAPEEGDIVRRRLDAQHEMELVVHLHLGFAEAMLDASALDAGLATRADFLKQAAA